MISTQNFFLEEKQNKEKFEKNFVDSWIVKTCDELDLMSGGIGSSGFRVASGVPPQFPLNDSIDKNLDLTPASEKENVSFNLFEMWLGVSKLQKLTFKVLQSFNYFLIFEQLVFYLNFLTF